MRKDIRENNSLISGVTLITLVVTIIVLLILASVSIAMLTGNNGILNKASEAKLENKRAAIRELIDTVLISQRTFDSNGEDIEILNKTKDELTKNNYEKLKQFGKEIEIGEVNTNESYFYVIVDKDVYKVSTGGSKYETTQSDKEITLVEGEIKYTYIPSNCTNGNVKVKIESNTDRITEYTIKYKIGNDTTWLNYSTEIELEKNCNIYAKLVGINGQSTVATGTVKNIDKLNPKVFTPTATSTNTTITVDASTTDAEATSDNASSGIYGYRFKQGNGTWTAYQKGGNYTFTGLTKNTNYTITVEAKDNAGNTTTGTVAIKTKNTYTVSYNSNGGTGAPASQTKIQGTNITLSTQIPTRDGYEFKGWGTSSNATTIAYNAGDTYSKDSDITLYAIWELKTITFSNGIEKTIQMAYSNVSMSNSTSWTTEAYVPANCLICIRIDHYDVENGSLFLEVNQNGSDNSIDEKITGNKDYYYTTSTNNTLSLTFTAKCSSESGAHSYGTVTIDYIYDKSKNFNYILK